MQKNFRLGAVAPTLAIGKQGPIIKSSGGSLVLRNPSDTADATLSGAPPVSSSDFATKQYVDGQVAWEFIAINAAAATYFDVVNLGTVPPDGTMFFDITFAAQWVDAPDGIGRSGIQKGLGYNVRQGTNPPNASSAYTAYNGGGATLPGFSTGGRVIAVGNDLVLQWRVTNAGLLHCRYRVSATTVADP